jgi:hypothetical protein
MKMKRSELVRRIVDTAGLPRNDEGRTHGYFTRLQLMELLLKIQAWKAGLDGDESAQAEPTEADGCTGNEGRTS